MARSGHYPFWPKGYPAHLDTPATTLYDNLAVSAARYPAKAAIIFYDSVITYSRLKSEVDAMAGYLQQRCGINHGDRIVLFSQNCPQFIVAYYAILRAGAVAVPVNAMSLTPELEHYITDSGARVAFAAQELFERLAPWLRSGAIEHVIVHSYADYLTTPTTLPLPQAVQEIRSAVASPGTIRWIDALAGQLAPGRNNASCDDLCVLPYTSGTTGKAKGCMHAHRTVMHATIAAQVWRQLQPSSVFLAVAPLFHVLGMQNGMNVPIQLGATIVMLSRWDRAAALVLIERYRVNVWAAPPAMVIDCFSAPDLANYDLSSLALLCGGGAAMPEAVATMLQDDFKVIYSEAYGLSETASFLHSNPLDRPKRQCIGLPTFNVDSRIIDPETLQELPIGEVGEIVTHAPQVMLGYWRNPTADADSFIGLEGKRFLRTGDLGYVDEEGYFFIRDRLKRMINVSGYKVWPAEIESLMYQHDAVHEACVIPFKDKQGNEKVKALLVLKPGWETSVTAENIVLWCRQHMSAYKVPSLVEFLDSLPKSSSGKILWRDLQESQCTQVG
ncbi:long-chain-fatty-acid--CoA ligase [Noviherbaspirillum soli]|uniref:long-chain-fatty-acid--CoA ligase n=1 Tax=Noviherbaspirillum soli TaxID=1064518 RepID=UPI00188CBCD9|nr:long-chain-fatty-acid--CoA ligase [Noviherbaspirillum soli]